MNGWCYQPTERGFFAEVPFVHFNGKTNSQYDYGFEQ
jgi:hypothetical protein